jgi:hypothetical protein
VRLLAPTSLEQQIELFNTDELLIVGFGSAPCFFVVYI